MSRFDKLVKEFAESVVAQTEAIRQGNSKVGNRHAKLYIRAFAALRSVGDEGRDALLPLLNDSRADVRGMAAAFLLRHRTKEARAVLQELAKGEGLVAFSAGETLRRWEEGNWSLDPPA
jgi:hypothetical protein